MRHVRPSELFFERITRHCEEIHAADSSVLGQIFVQKPPYRMTRMADRSNPRDLKRRKTLNHTRTFLSI